jgi:hypothetical protein
VTSALLLALALASAAPEDQEPPQPPQPPQVAPNVEVETPVAGGDHGGWRHAAAAGVHSTTFFSKEGSQYTFHSGSLGYLGSIGRIGAFLQAFLLMPLQARQDGHVYATGSYYKTRSGGDLLFGPQMRWTVRGVEAEVGPGFHGTFIYLPGKSGYRDFTALPLGAGVGAVVRWDTRRERLSRVVNLGTYASFAYDFYDPMHAEDLSHGFTFRAGVILGLGARR